MPLAAVLCLRRRQSSVKAGTEVCPRLACALVVCAERGFARRRTGWKKVVETVFRPGYPLVGLSVQAGCVGKKGLFVSFCRFFPLLADTLPGASVRGAGWGTEVSWRAVPWPLVEFFPMFSPTSQGRLDGVHYQPGSQLTTC